LNRSRHAGRHGNSDGEPSRPTDRQHAAFEDDPLLDHWKQLARAGTLILITETLRGEALIRHMHRIDAVLQETATPVTVICAPQSGRLLARCHMAANFVARRCFVLWQSS